LPAPTRAGIPTGGASAAAERRDSPGLLKYHSTAHLSAGIPTGGASAAAERRDDSWRDYKISFDSPNKGWHPDRRSKQSGVASGRFLAGLQDLICQPPQGLASRQAKQAKRRSVGTRRGYEKFHLPAPTRAGIPTGEASKAA